MNYAPKHSKGWHPRTERADFHLQDQAAMVRHRRTPKHLTPANPYEHLTYTVVEKAVA